MESQLTYGSKITLKEVMEVTIKGAENTKNETIKLNSLNSGKQISDVYGMSLKTLTLITFEKIYFRIQKIPR